MCVCVCVCVCMYIYKQNEIYPISVGTPMIFLNRAVICIVLVLEVWREDELMEVACVKNRCMVITNSQQRVFTDTCVRLVTVCRTNVISELRRGRCLEIALTVRRLPLMRLIYRVS